MQYEAILVSVEDGVATITFNRPERMNAWSAQMAAETSAALRAANGDDAVRAMREGRLFTWAGNQPDSKEGVLSFLEKRAPAWQLSVTKDTPRELLGA
jgi:enoyl-CoA hydratase/carnithine racemase